MRPALRVGREPGEIGQQPRIRSIEPSRIRLGLANIFPLRFGRQTVAGSIEKTGAELHPLAYFGHTRITHFLLSDDFLLAEPATVGNSLKPGHRNFGQLGSGE